MANELQQYINGAIVKYELKVNDKYLKENILALEELKMKNGNSYMSLVNWPKEMVEAKLYRKLALEMGIDISDIDLDEKEIKEDGNFEYISFNDSTVAKNQGQMSDEPLSNNINTPSYKKIADTNDNVVKEEDISNVIPVFNNNDEEWARWE
ncbi:hypothetical protein [Spiroplasma endosymbiont of Stenodema calcarata]|uniref:hypothetical protein n=1 Tax=Spiroplasma endosymbiont of Stenodema calcarata TaxID=3139328 RepID=UPI003CCABFFC